MIELAFEQLKAIDGRIEEDIAAPACHQGWSRFR